MRDSKLMSKVYDKDSNEGPDIKLKEKPVKKKKTIENVKNLKKEALTRRSAFFDPKIQQHKKFTLLAPIISRAYI